MIIIYQTCDKPTLNCFLFLKTHEHMLLSGDLLTQQLKVKVEKLGSSLLPSQGLCGNCCALEAGLIVK